jgi:DNA polymerase-3 subunit beta
VPLERQIANKYLSENPVERIPIAVGGSIPGPAGSAGPQGATTFAIECRRDDLIGALAAAGAAVNAKVRIPILSHVLVQCGPGECVVTGTNLDVRIARRIACTASNDRVAFTLPWDGLGKRLAALPAGDIRIEVDSAGVLRQAQQARIAGGTSMLEVDTLPPGDFPAEPEIAVADRYGIEAKDLRRIIGNVEHAISKEETRYYLCGACFHCVEDGRLRLVATDGHRLAIDEAPTASTQGGLTTAAVPVVVPAGTVRIVKTRCLAAGGTVAVASGAGGIGFTFEDGTVVTSRVIESPFPDYRRVVPRGNDKQARIDRRALDQTLRGVPRRKRGEAPALVKLAFEEGTLDVSGAHGNTRLACEWNGGPFTISFQAAYLRDAIAVLGDEVCMAMKDPLAPVLLRSGAAFPQVVLMPCVAR